MGKRGPSKNTSWSCTAELEFPNPPAGKHENWARISGHPGYWVSDLGRIYSEMKGGTGDLMNTSNQTTGYPYVGLYTQGDQIKYTVHSLVMEAHGPQKPSDDALINHINRDKTDNRLENLEWVSELENRLHTAVMEYVDQHGLSAFLDRICEWL